MPSIRKLPSGKWQATVRHPSGQRITKTDPLKRVVQDWARDEEARYARGDIRDPRAGHITVGDWYARWIKARGVEDVTKDKLASSWRSQCGPQWSKWRMDAVTRLEAQAWATALRSKRRQKHRGRLVEDDDEVPTLAAGTIHTAVHLMSSLYRAALDERPPIVLSNPFERLEVPTAAPSVPVFFTEDEALAIVAATRRLRPNEPQWPVLIQLGMWVGLRPGELFGLHGHRVEWLRKRVEVTHVMTRRGIREYPKTKKSHRVVPVPEWILTEASVLMKDRPSDALLLTMPQGGVIRDPDFRHRIWYPAVKEAGVRPLPPRAMRHTAASWLVQDGVPLYDVQALLGHESYATTQRYAHLQPDAHAKVVASWSRRTGDARDAKIKKIAG